MANMAYELANPGEIGGVVCPDVIPVPEYDNEGIRLENKRTITEAQAKRLLNEAIDRVNAGKVID